MANAQTHILLIAMTLLFGLLLSVVVFMLVYLIMDRRKKLRHTGWKKIAEQTIMSAIFHEEPDQPIGIPDEAAALTQNHQFRDLLTEEILAANKDLAGSAAENLRLLYNQLNLDKESQEKLGSLKWHIKARGIQELAAMHRKDRVGRIYRNTNNRNEFIRMEAQLAIVHLYGHEGLRFLDVVSEPITEWQQIKLLSQLPAGTDDDLAGMSRWLNSPNHSVIAFALKLASTHRRFDLHDTVAACLQHPNPQIRILALRCLEHIANETTPQFIIKEYSGNGLHYRTAALEVLAAIASPDEIPFLETTLDEEDHNIKLLAARILARLGAPGRQILDLYPKAGEHPYNEIFQQATSEVAA